jgi:hypothetical protein
MAASTEFSVYLGVVSYSQTYFPALEWHCLQNEFCTYSAPSRKSISSPATFADFSSYRGNLVALAAGSSLNEVTLQDGSSLYGATCTGANCDAVLYRYNSGRDRSAYCPIGSEMIVTASGLANEGQSYLIRPSPRVTLVGDMPSTCLFVDGLYRCESGQATLAFTRVERPCDTLSAGDCPFPLVGRTFGTCAAEDLCLI